MSVCRWVSVPGGRVEQPAGADPLAVLRVLMAPRLDRDLAGTAMANWPPIINAAAPVVEVRTAGGVHPVPGTTLRRLANPAVWQGFFGHGITVNPWRPAAPRDAPTVAPTLETHADITEVYRAVAVQPRSAETVRAQLEGWRPPPEPAPPLTGTPNVAKVDFHRAVALLREHPHVLKSLGLIIEITMPVTALPRASAHAPLAVRVRWDQSPIPVESPWTAYEFDETIFVPASSGDIKSGVVDLDDVAKWEVIKVDVDGAVGKLNQAKRVVLEGTDPGAVESAMLPALKSAGLQLARKNRDQILAERTERSNASLAPGAVDRDLFAEDLVLGYRIDIRPAASHFWFSLHARTANYKIDGVPIGAANVVEEGHLKPNAAVVDTAGLRTDAIVARWNGWSLAVPRPSVGAPAAAKPAADDLIPYKFTAEFTEIPGTVPELRFGISYQMRARVADVAGGGLQRDDVRAEGSPTEVVPYTRWEPVPPPELPLPGNAFIPDPERPGKLKANPAAFGPGGAVDRLVLRSAPTQNGVSTAEFDADPHYPANHSRTLTTPVTSIELADQHGMMSVPEPESSRLALRAGLVSGVSDLPDPMALGVAAAALKQPGGPDRDIVDTRPWAGTWPDPEPKRIELVAGNADDEIDLIWVASGADVTPNEDARSPAVRVTVPAGQTVTVEVSSIIDQDRLDWFAFKLLASSADADEVAVQGRHPLLTPPRRLQAVHAVRKPLKAPSGSLTAARPAGSTFADLAPAGVLGLHTPSTAQLELRAEWDEWGDTAKPIPGVTTALPPITVAYGAAELPTARHEFGDTKHRMITYTATAVSRYREYFAAGEPNENFRVPGVLDPQPVSVKSTARPAPPAVIATVPAFGWSDAPAPGGGIVRTRTGGRLRVELGRPWYTTGQGECLAVLLWLGAEEAVPQPARQLVSWVNRDPIHATAAPTALATEALFTAALNPVDLPLVETGDRVRVLPYPVFFEDERWFADIEIPGAAAGSYCPFVQLALARYQPESLEGLSLSTAVRTDIVPVLPDRALDVRQDAAGVHVTLTGRGRDGQWPNQVTATLEQCPPSVDRDTVELTSLTTGAPAFPAWSRVPNKVVNGPLGQPLPPLTLPGGDAPMRVLIRETEDIESPSALIDSAGEVTERTVYLDIVALPLGT